MTATSSSRPFRRNRPRATHAVRLRIPLQHVRAMLHSPSAANLPPSTHLTHTVTAYGRPDLPKAPPPNPPPTALLHILLPSTLLPLGT